jgi:hypothetical protein
MNGFFGTLKLHPGQLLEINCSVIEELRKESKVFVELAVIFS